MFGRLIEKFAAKKDPRFHTFVEGKTAYESYIKDSHVRFDEMSEEHYRRARQDLRLSNAVRELTKAIEMSENNGALADAATAKCQLGFTRHAQGELDEAKKLMVSALKVISNLPQRNRSADMSSCHYHLGVIAKKQGHLQEAVHELRQARQIDEANADIGGMKLCDILLAKCAEEGADIEAPSPPLTTDTGCWDIPEDTGPIVTEKELHNEFVDKAGPVHYDERELIWLASFSVEANDLLMANLDSLAEDFGRPVTVSRAAFGAADPALRHLHHPEPDQHLCAAILVLERAGLYDQNFQQLAIACMERVIAMPDFRLLLYLHDLTIDNLRELSDRMAFVALLFDTTQIAETPSLEQLRRTLVPYLRQVEHIRAAEKWRNIRPRLTVMCGHLANTILFAAAMISMLGFPVWLLKSNLAWIGPYGPTLASLVLGMLAFPLQSPLIYLLLRGMRTAAMAPKDNAALMRWVVFCGVILISATHFQYGLKGPYSWIYLGLAIGVLLDSIRRAGKNAKRQMIDLNALVGHANDPALQDPSTTVLRGDPLNPFSCPLLPSLSARVFISYTRSSAKGSRFAAALHRGLQKANVTPFLDRANIPAGASWRRSLNRHLGECDTFICILDEKGVQREWVAAEIIAAVKAHWLTGNPQIMILLEPAIKRLSQGILPVFQGIIAASSQPPIQGRPQIIELNENTQSSIVWALTPGRFMPASVFTRGTAMLIIYTLIPLGWLGGLGIFAGFILGFLAILDIMAKFPLVSVLVERGWLAPVTLLTAFWLGFTARAAIAWGYERDHGREMGMAAPVCATIGLAYAALLFLQKVPILIAGWSVVLMVAGWMMVTFATRMGHLGDGHLGDGH